MNDMYGTKSACLRPFRTLSFLLNIPRVKTLGSVPSSFQLVMRQAWNRGCSRISRVCSLTLPCWAVGLTGLLPVFASANDTTPELPEKHFAFLEKYCFECHDALTEKAKVNLEDIAFQVTTIAEAELWQKVLNSMNSGEMPPEDEPQPENTEKADFLDALAQTMVWARRSLSDSGGEITMRRLNRREYQNTIQQLLGVGVDVDSLPADGGSGTLDTVGASQFISSDQIEQYLKLGRSAIDELFERQAAMGQESRIFRVEPEKTVNVQSLEKLAKLEETNERYLLWKAEVDKAALDPENQKVMDELRMKFPGLDDRWRLRLYQNADLLKKGPDAKKFGF
ncbi:MAG: hypothetical protein ACI8UO_002883 [Verrucomicrobiales bacterium]|jgi:hypothetical protein